MTDSQAGVPEVRMFFVDEDVADPGPSRGSTGPPLDNSVVDEEEKQTMLSAASAKGEKKKQFVAPDGGCRAWTVMVCSFFCNGIIFGIINSCGAIFNALKARYDELDHSDAATKASLIGAFAIGATFALSPVSGMLADRFGVRKTAFFGGLIATAGLLLSSFFIDHIEVLCFTYGIMFGSGSSLVYTPSLSILGHYFRRRLGLVNGIVAAGSSTFTMVLPHVLTRLLGTVGIANCFRLLAAMSSFLMVAALFFKPLIVHEREEEPAQHGSRMRSKCYKICSKIVYIDNWRNAKYVVWCLVVPFALFGYFVPYMHISQYVKDVLDGKDGSVLVTCMAATSFLGRLLFGKIVDHHWASGIALQQIAFLAIGTCTMLLTVAPYFGSFAFYALVGFSLLMGLFDGCFITMFGPIAHEICGDRGVSQGIGFILGLSSIPLTVGPMAAGMFYDKYGNYTAAFVLAGLPPILASIAMCLIYKVGATNPPHAYEEELDEEEPHEVENDQVLGESKISETAATMVEE